MKLIVAGLGRTGTQSLTQALEQLGLRVASQRALMSTPGLADAALGAVHGRAPMDWSVLAGFDATAGWPLCFLVEDQVARFPDAPVLLNTRPAADWYESVAKAWPVLTTMAKVPLIPKKAFIQDMVGMLESRMGGPLDRAAWMAGHDAHIAHVRAVVPPERLIEYPLGSGWGPICEALDLPVPDTPFPRGNSSKDGSFQQTLMKLLKGGG